jgi:predicted 2-oxoglutarate/Fe(II)-dependent dioxygenase YbiX
LTVILFLESSRDVDPAGGFNGGVLRLFPEAEEAPLEIIPRRGMLVAFPADTLHEVTLVESGHRDTVVDWIS